MYDMYQCILTFLPDKKEQEMYGKLYLDGVFELSERITEVIVPTLSYRMGVKVKY